VGKCLVFDDSLQHSAIHPKPDQRSSSRGGGGGGSGGGRDGGGPRVVLIVDLWHPDLTLDERTALSHVYPAP
jgi:hypothetical protein